MTEPRPNIQIDDLVREMTTAEYEVYQQKQITAEAETQAKEAKIASRTSALAKLAALGLTEAEIDAL